MLINPKRVKRYLWIYNDSIMAITDKRYSEEEFGKIAITNRHKWTKKLSTEIETEE